VVWDSGASISISPSRDNFDGKFTTTSSNVTLQGLAKGLKILGYGYVEWLVMLDMSSQIRVLEVPVFCVPSCRHHLLSLTSLSMVYSPETYTGNPQQITMSDIDGNPTRGSVIALVDSALNLPTSYLVQPSSSHLLVPFHPGQSHNPQDINEGY
jgi:hypothetical protein